MKLGLRGKLVTLLTVVALLPLVAATVIGVVAERRIRIESFGGQLQAKASAEAELMELSLTGDAKELLLVLNEGHQVELVAAGRRELSAAEREKRDAIWKDLPDSDPMLRSVLEGPLAGLLKLIQTEDRRVAEILLTDRYGQLIAATGRTSDFYQADEGWWQSAYREGRGCVFVPPIDYDRSGGVWSVDLCIPIRRGKDVVGVAKAVLNVTEWIGTHARDVGGFAASAMLVGEDGRVVFRPGGEPLKFRSEKFTGRPLGGEISSWWETADGDLQAAARIRLPARVGSCDARSPTWTLVLYMPKGGPLKAANRVSLLSLAVGLAIVAGFFLAGLGLVERSIVRRVRRLVHATREVAAGDLAYRIGPDWPTRRLLGADEIDGLARDFNEMIGQVQQSHEELREANELKSRLIKIAGHELRTPVSYLLGMAALLSDTRDVERLAKGVAAMGERGRRLDAIIQAMFKLLPQQSGGRVMRIASVSISEVLEEVHQDCLPFLAHRGQQLTVEVAENVPEVRADRAMLRDVVENLLRNAIKFSPDGGEIAIRAGLQLGEHVSIAVTDQGSGIPDGEVPHLFEPFFTGGEVFQHSSGESGYQKRGMGLGLAIVRHFVQLHGGTVNVSSSPAGSTFTVTIPVRRPT